MASSSSSSPQWEPVVFASFSSKDKNFMSPLFCRLNQVGIRCSGNDHGEEAIPQARFALVMFSTNYANSNRCLNELVNILECKRNHAVIPIFYMDRKDVSNLARDGKFERALRKMDETQRHDKKTIWRSALAKAKEIEGYELKAANGDELKKLIDKVVGRLVNQIHSRYSGRDFTFGPFGRKGQNDWNSVAIRGIAVDFGPFGRKGQNDWNSVAIRGIAVDFGPFGRKGQNDWNSVATRGIAVVYGDFIKSITFEVDKNTSYRPQNDGKRFFQVKLEEGEYITSFSGHLKEPTAGHIRINSLTFRTNKRILGPIGRVEAEEEDFFVPSKGGEVIKIFWRGKKYLESIGACVKLPSGASAKFYPVKSLGLFGMESGSKWDDGNQHACVRQIIYELDSSGERFIRSIAFEYEEENENLRRWETHGPRDGTKMSIKMDRQEYLTSISGHHTDNGITSLTFLINERRTETIGDEIGTPFSFPATDGKIVGFYGWSDEHLRGIGAHFKTEPSRGENAWDDKKFDGVREIRVLLKLDIGYIKFVYDNGSEEGCTFTSGDRTLRDSIEEGTVRLDYPREYLTWISGYMRENGAIQSLTFYSNRRQYGPYGERTGKYYFCYPSTGSRIIGFYGTWGGTFKSIGVHAEPIPHLYPFKTVGPYGNPGETSWDDGVHTGVRGFRVIAPGRKIESVTFKYDYNGSLVEGSPHGDGNVSSGEWVLLDFPKERLLSIEGYWREGREPGQTIIHDLTIYTTKRRNGYQTYAWTGESDRVRATSTSFSIAKESDKGRRIVGFFGTAGECLNSIGARLEPY